MAAVRGALGAAAGGARAGLTTVAASQEGRHSCLPTAHARQTFLSARDHAPITQRARRQECLPSRRQPGMPAVPWADKNVCPPDPRWTAAVNGRDRPRRGRFPPVRTPMPGSPTRAAFAPVSSRPAPTRRPTRGLQEASVSSSSPPAAPGHYGLPKSIRLRKSFPDLLSPAGSHTVRDRRDNG
jgi:hypothetical protein